jgi:CRP-like cAMP-binding protein
MADLASVKLFKNFLAEHPTVAWRLLQTLNERLRKAQAEAD